MAKGKKTGGRNFAKGNTANPHGGLMPKDIVQIRTLTSIDFNRIAISLLYTPMDELRKIYANGATFGIHAMIAGMIITAAEKTCTYRANFILDRVLGRVAGPNEINVNVGSPAAMVPTVVLSLDDMPPAPVIDAEALRAD